MISVKNIDVIEDSIPMIKLMKIGKVTKRKILVITLFVGIYK